MQRSASELQRSDGFISILTGREVAVVTKRGRRAGGVNRRVIQAGAHVILFVYVGAGRE